MLRQQAYRIRQKERGFKLIEIWVPADREVEFKEKATKARKKHTKAREAAS